VGRATKGEAGGPSNAVGVRDGGKPWARAQPSGFPCDQGAAAQQPPRAGQGSGQSAAISASSLSGSHLGT